MQFQKIFVFQVRKEMIDKKYLSNNGLSEKARGNLRRNAELRTNRRIKRHSMLILRDGEEVIRIFDPDQIEPREIEFENNGDKKQKIDYTVTDPNTGDLEIIPASIKVSGDIDALLIEGHRLLKIRREGLGKYDTRYYVTQVEP